MNDEELEQRLRDELHQRIQPPTGAPVDLWQRVDRQFALEPVSVRRSSAFGGAAGYSRGRLGAVGGLAAAAAIAALVAGALMMRTSAPATIGGPLPSKVEMFARIDANTAWAAVGADLYITRDGGTTWSKGTLPGKGLGQVYAEPTPTPSCDASGNCYYGSPFPERLYPDFIDADHGWLVTWKVSNPANPTRSDFALSVNRTSDGGKTWTASAVPGVYKGIGIVRFLDRAHGTLVVFDLGLSSQTSTTAETIGASPEPTPEPTPAASAVPDATTVLTTSDGGAHWARKSTLPGYAIVTMISPEELWAGDMVPMPGSQPGMVWHSTNGGAAWSSAQLPDVSGCNYVQTLTAAPTRTAHGLELIGVCSSYLVSGGGTASATPAPAPNPSIAQSSVTPGPVETAASSGGGTEPVPPEPSSTIVTLESANDGASWTVAAERSATGAAYNGLAGGLAFYVSQRMTQPLTLATQTGGSTSAFEVRATFDGGLSWRSVTATGLPGVPFLTSWASSDDVWVGAWVPSPQGSSYPSMALYASKDGGKAWHALLGSTRWPASPEPVPTPVPVPTPMPIASGETLPVKAPGFGPVGVNADGSGWAVRGNAVWTTSDGGAKWSTAAVPVANDWQSAVAVLDSERFAGAERDPADNSRIRIVLTDDGGKTFAEHTVSLPSAAVASNIAIHYASAAQIHLFVGADSPSAASLCLRIDSPDGGNTWDTATAPCNLQWTTWVTNTLGYTFDFVATGDRAADVSVAVTSDGGTTWVSAKVPAPAEAAGGKPLGGFLTAGPEPGSLAGFVQWALPTPASMQALTVLLKSTDGGRMWSSERGAAQDFMLPGTPAVLGPGHWLGAATDLATTSDPAAIVETRDWGATWTRFAANGLPGTPQALVFADESAGWATVFSNACQYCAGADAIYATRDGGHTWTAILQAK